jgi:hypothetical protein
VSWTGIDSKGTGSNQRNQGQRDQTSGQAPQRQQSQTGQAPQQGQAQQGQAGSSATGQAGSASATGQAGSVNLTSQQRTTIQQTVLAGSNVPRVNNVDFALSVGTVVPTRVRIVDVPPALIEINPAWHGHQYFVVRDEIVIVDRSRKVVAVVPVGSSGGAQLKGRGGAGALSLSSDQIRQVQIVLKEKGFDVEVDGVLGPRTTRALTTFQRQQGFQVTGRIDNQTVTALGLSNMTGAQGGATTGQGSSAGTTQGGSAQQQTPAQQNQGANQPSTSGQTGSSQQAPAQQNQNAGKAGQPSTTGQSGSSQAPQQNQSTSQQPSAQQGQGANQPSTSGQAGSAQQQKPAQDQQQGGSK